MMFRDRLEQMISEADAKDGADSKAALLSMLRELANGIDTVAVRTGLFSISAVPAAAPMTNGEYMTAMLDDLESKVDAVVTAPETPPAG